MVRTLAKHVAMRIRGQKKRGILELKKGKKREEKNASNVNL